MIFAQEGLGVETFSPLGIFILIIGVALTVGLFQKSIMGRSISIIPPIIRKIKHSIQ